MNNEAILTVRSVTHASKGKRLLLSHGINSRIIKPASSQNQQNGAVSPSNAGCVYGLAVSLSNIEKASDILESNGIDIKEITYRQSFRL